MKNILLTSLLSSFLTCWGMTALLRATGHLYFPWVWLLAPISIPAVWVIGPPILQAVETILHKTFRR
jgi:hypothetical protein